MRILVLLVCLVLLGGCGSYPESTTPPVQPTPGEVAEPPVKKPPVYEIVGKSNQLTAQQWAAMQKWRTDMVKLAKDRPEQVYINGFTETKKVCLTFDDGPDQAITPQILDILRQNGVKANFFFVGNKLAANREVVKRAYEDGNLVLSHAWSHAQLTAKSPEQIQTELSRTENKLQEIIGQKPALVRPPYGDLNPQVADEFKRQGCKAVLWSVDTLDWSQREKANIVKNITGNIRPGDIILMHSDAGKTATVAALPVIIAELKKQGYQCVDLGELLGQKPYK